MAKVRDVTDQPPVRRMSVVRGRLALKASTCASLLKEGMELLATAKVAGIQAAKDSGRILPTALPVALTDAFCDVQVEKDHAVVTMTVQAHARTTLEGAALCGGAAALLALWEACKPMEQDGQGNYAAARITELAVVQNVVA
jgi:cyclic pyranopterin phosphate synthase